GERLQPGKQRLQHHTCRLRIDSCLPHERRQNRVFCGTPSAQAAQVPKELLRRREPRQRRLRRRPTAEANLQRTGGKRRPLGLEPLDQIRERL
ncbi:MAG: hypothetical protein KGL16_07725, partial [Acidobacteriota bacterium]|nr:hypothetical protein [Acidobacteriota bacterium]